MKPTRRPPLAVVAWFTSFAALVGSAALAATPPPTPAPTAPPAATSAPATPAPATPAPAPTRAASGPVRVVLVDAQGDEDDLDAFISHLQSEASDRQKVSIVDARLAGARLGVLAADPDGSAARAFRAEWPGEYLLSVDLAPCQVKAHSFTMRDTTPDGYPYQRTIVDVSVSCTASLRAVEEVTGRQRLTEDVTGTATLRRSEDEETGPEREGILEAAKKAARRLEKKLGR